MPSNVYERFRQTLAANLYNVLDNDQIQKTLEAVDISLNSFEIEEKRTDIIPAFGIPEVVKMYIASKAIANLSYKTLNQYRYKLINFFGSVHKSYMDICTNDIRMYLYNYKTAHSASDRYIENIRLTLQGFFKWLVGNHYLQDNPCANVDPVKYKQKKRNPMSMYELETVRYCCENIREKALIDFLFSTGCRVSECTDVRLSDVDWNRKSVLIRNGKGGKQRTVYFDPETEVSLKAYLQTRADSTDALFVSVRKPYNQIGSHALENIVKRIGERCGIKVFPHKFRHTFATSSLRRGMPIEKLQMLLGHEDPATTLIYAKINQQDLQSQYNQLFS